jgi:signal transduction histidine kinase
MRKSRFPLAGSSQQILLAAVRIARPRGAWVADAERGALIVAATWGGPDPGSPSFEIDKVRPLRKMRRSRGAVICLLGDGNWRHVPHPVGKDSAYWACFPLVTRGQVVGALALWGKDSLTGRNARRLKLLVSENAPKAWLGHQIKAVTASLVAGSDGKAPAPPEQAVRKLLALLAQALPARRVVLWVPSGGRVIHEFALAGRRFSAATIPALGSLRFPGIPEGKRLSTRAFRLTRGGKEVGILVLEGAGRTEVDDYSASLLGEFAGRLTVVLGAAGNRRVRDADTTRPQVNGGSAPDTGSPGGPEERLVQASKLIAVGEMAAGIAHELNNPLTTVAGFAELVLDEIPPDAPFRADVEMVLHEAQRARSVVRRLLDFARQGEAVRSRTDIAEIVDDVLTLTTNFIHTSGVQLEVIQGRDLPWILVDGNQMKQVLLNIIHNAIQAMPAGGRLTVRTETRQADGRAWIVVRVADTGLGIRATDMQRIFEPFFTTRANHGGTGLGLSVSYGIVADHGGRIEVDSQPGAGSTFSVWLPA